MNNGMRAIHPGEILWEDYIKPSNLQPCNIEEVTGLSMSLIHGLVTGYEGITEDTAAKLAKAFDTTPEFWLNLQQTYDEKTK